MDMQGFNDDFGRSDHRKRKERENEDENEEGLEKPVKKRRRAR